MRALGQNFLVDTGVRDAIVEASGVGPGDLVLEIGPGRGALTRVLAERVSVLVAVEVDPELAAYLQRELADLSHVHIIHADILSCDIGQIALTHARQAPGPLRFMVVANLPYCITTPVLHRLLSASSLFEAFTLMVQMDFDVHVGIAVLRQPVGDIARQFQAFGRLIEDALPQAPACSFMLAAVVVSSATAYTVDDDCADETGVIANLRVSADYQLVVGTGHVMHVGHYVVERLI
jgi:hypothetical protein